MNLTRAQVIDIYEKVLADNEDELFLHHTEGERNSFYDGAYLLYVALADGARR